MRPDLSFPRTSLAMQHLYSASVVRPLSAAGTVANRLGYSLLSWSESDDLVAVISGDGSVHIFHADAPAETTMLLANKRAPARHVAWRPRRDKPPLLLVADASSRLTIWIAKVRPREDIEYAGRRGSRGRIGHAFRGMGL